MISAWRPLGKTSRDFIAFVDLGRKASRNQGFALFRFNRNSSLVFFHQHNLKHICSSNWIMKPRKIGVNIPNIFEWTHHLEFVCSRRLFLILYLDLSVLGAKNMVPSKKRVEKIHHPLGFSIGTPWLESVGTSRRSWYFQPSFSLLSLRSWTEKLTIVFQQPS